MGMTENFDEMAAVLLERFEVWASSQPNGEQLLEAMDMVDEVLDSEEELGAQASWAVSRAAHVLAAAASRVVGFELIAVTYQTIAGMFGVAAAARRGKR